LKEDALADGNFGMHHIRKTTNTVLVEINGVKGTQARNRVFNQGTTEMKTRDSSNPALTQAASYTEMK